VSEGEDSPMSDEEEEENEDYEEEGETSEDESDEIEVETDSGDDEGTSDGPESDPRGSGKHRPSKEDAKTNVGVKGKTNKVRDGKIKKKKIDGGNKGLKTAATAVQKKLDVKKGKKNEKKSTSSEKEIQAKPIESLEKKDVAESSADVTGEKQKKAYPIFEDKNVDYNFVKNSPSNIVQRRCQIAQNIIVSCKNIEIFQNGQYSDIASLAFSRKTKNGRAFDYNMPLSLAPTLIEAIEAIIKDNAKFFAKIENKEKF